MSFYNYIVIITFIGTNIIKITQPTQQKRKYFIFTLVCLHLNLINKKKLWIAKKY